MGIGNSTARSGSSTVGVAGKGRRSNSLICGFRRKSSNLTSKKEEVNDVENNSTAQRIMDQHVQDESLITVHDFYNLLNDGAFTPYIHDPGNMLLIDAREESSFLQLHVITATHHSECEVESSHMFSMIIIYRNSINNDASELFRLKESFSNEIAGEVLVLKEGFDAFSKIYPFMCTDTIINSWGRRVIVTYPSVILEGQLYQGKGDQAKNEDVISNLKITHVLNITTEHINAFEDKLKYLKLTIEDESSSDLFTHLTQTTEFIESALNSGGCVLVHCNLGVSRSSTATLAYLIKSKKMTLSDAYAYLKSRRSCIRPNLGFLKQLSNWEASVFGTKITDIDSL